MIRKIYSALSSVKLALALLIVILVSCIAGVTIFRGDRSWALVFNTLWFNGLLVLLVLNVAFCFFPRMWGRKLTLVSFGMILFHLSFVAILLGVVYNSFFYFRGVIRLTEGETLLSGDPESYDAIDKGRFFDFAKLKGETTLIKMHRGYTVNGQDKQVAYEVAVGGGASKKQSIIYATHKLENDGFGYFRDREGYSILVILYDKREKELYGAYVPLQSLKQKDDSYLYITGTKAGPESLPFPQNPATPFFALQAAYRPSALKEREREGEASFQIRQLREEHAGPEAKALAEGTAKIGGKVKVGEYYLSPGEVRYWVAMSVRYEPGKPIVLASLWAGLGGMILTFAGRMTRGRA